MKLIHCLEHEYLTSSIQDSFEFAVIYESKYVFCVLASEYFTRCPGITNNSHVKLCGRLTIG